MKKKGGVDLEEGRKSRKIGCAGGESVERCRAVKKMSISEYPVEMVFLRFPATTGGTV